MQRWLVLMGLIGLIGIARGAPANAHEQVKSFAATLNSRMNMPMKGGMDTLKAYDGDNAYERLKAAGAYDVWFGAPAPAAVNGKRCYISTVNDYSSARAKTLGEAIEQMNKYGQEKGQRGDPFYLLFIGLGLPDYPVPRAAVQNLIPLARFGNYGLFAVPGTSPEVVAALSMLAQKASSPKLMEEVSLTTLSAQAGGAEELASLVANQPEYSAGSETSSVAAVAVNTVGPQIKGYDPREAARPPPGPPPLKHIDTKGPNFIKGIGTWPDSNLEIERERKAREAQAAAAKKPRLTMADYASKAEQEKAEFQVKKAQAAADHKQVLNWLVNDRNTKEADITQRLQKRREYVDGQANRNDAVVADSPVENGNSTADGTEHWVVVHFHNKTDVTLDVTYRYWGGPPGDQYQREYRTVLLPLQGAHWVTIFASPRGWIVNDPLVTWKASPGDYQVKY